MPSFLERLSLFPLKKCSTDYLVRRVVDDMLDIYWPIRRWHVCPHRERGEEGSKVEKRKEEEGGFIMHASNVDKT